MYGDGFGSGLTAIKKCTKKTVERGHHAEWVAMASE
jgi:hypothetical protein